MKKEPLYLYKGLTVKTFATILFAVYMVLTVAFGVYLYNAKTTSAQNHIDRMDPSIISVDYTEGDYTEVLVGTYIDSIKNVDIANSSFESTFYIWFAWDGATDFDPGSSFQLVGGEILSKETVSEHYTDGGENYQRYKVTASFEKHYDLTRVSLEDHLLNFYIEDSTRDSAKLRYVADTEQTAISSRVNVAGFDNSDEVQSVVKPHEYKSTYSSPSADGNRVFSQYVVGVPVARADVGFYLKIAVPFLLSVFLGLMALWSHRTGADALGLSGASFFGVVANAYIVTSYVPSNGGSFGILDMINVASLMTVLLVATVSIISLTLRSQNEDSDVAGALDLSCFAALTAGYLIFNIVVPICASSMF